MLEENLVWYKKLWKWLLKQRSIIFHWIILIVLTVYIIRNWDSCISMQFFSNFNGDNILFFVWIILIFLMLYDVEAKGVKLKKRELKEELDIIDMQHRINAMSHTINQVSDESSASPGEEPVNDGSSN